MALPASLRALSARQLALFTLDQAREARVTQDVLDNRVRSGDLERPHPGVFAIAGVAWTWDRRLLAACLAGGEPTFASHRSAATLWELADLDDPPLEITTRRSRSPRFEAESDLIIHRPRRLDTRRVTRRRGIPVSNPLLTVVDLAAVANEQEIVAALDNGVATKLFTIAAVDRFRAHVAKPGRPGPGRLCPCLESRDPGKDGASVLESRMARLWRRFGLPEYVFQHIVRTSDGRFVARVDFAIVDLMIAIEVKGWRTHGSPTAVDVDDRRTNRLLALGWIVVEFSWWRVVHEPDQVAAEILAIVRARTAAA